MNKWIYRYAFRPPNWWRLDPKSRSYASPARKVYKANIPVQTPPKVTPARSNLPLKTELKTEPKWPFHIIKSARDAGALDVSTEVSIAFLKDIWRLVSQGKLNTKNVQAALEGHDINPPNLTSIARLMITQRSEFQVTSLGLDLLSMAADLGDDTAAFILVDMAVESKGSVSIGASRYRKALSRVKKLATEQNNLQALVLLGKVYEQAQQFQDALNSYEVAMLAHENDIVYDDDRTALAEAFRNAGRLTLISPEHEEVAFKYFEIAAREYEDAYSFYSMALMRGEDHPDFVALLSQAAVSGVLEAAYELGLWYSKRGDDLISEKEARNAFSMASYWFELAESLPKLAPRAILHGARLQRVQNLETQQLIESQTIQLALENAGIPSDIQQLWIKNWSDRDFRLRAAHLESYMDEAKK